MAVTISIEFTDEQWALVNKHYPNFVANDAGALVHQDITAEVLKGRLFESIKAEVSECLMNTAKSEAANSAATSLENCFDV